MSERITLSDVAPALRRRVLVMPPLPLQTTSGIRATRTLTNVLARMATSAGVRRRVVQAGSVRLRLFEPAAGRPAHDGGRGLLVWIHGGGFVIGTAAQDDRFCTATARELGIVVASLEYRLAPEHPYPAALDDVVDAWLWLRRNVSALGVDPARIAVGGQSAGGGLAACLVHRLRDAGGGAPVAQWLFCPMLDDRTAARRELDAIRHRVWNNRLNRIGWRAYLGAEPGGAQVPADAAAARRSDLTALPATWIGVGSIDLFHDENLAYAHALRAAGVDCTLDVVPGAPHGFEAWAAGARPAKEFVGRARTWLAQALEVGTIA